MRLGVITAVEAFERARKPSYRLTIDFGPEIGVRRSAAGAQREYTPEQLLGRQVVAVVNFEPRNIAGFMSEVLVLGVEDAGGALVLLGPDRPGRLGSRVY